MDLPIGLGKALTAGFPINSLYNTSYVLKILYTEILCNNDNLTPTIFEYNQLTLNFIPSVKTNDLSRI